jgi:hypothetical protein
LEDKSEEEEEDKEEEKEEEDSGGSGGDGGNTQYIMEPSQFSKDMKTNLTIPAT